MSEPKRVLVPVDGSDLSMDALAVALADYPDAAVTVLHVMDPISSGFGIIDVMRPKFRDGAPPGSVSPEVWQEWYDEAHAAAEAILEAAEQTAEAAGGTVTTAVEVGTPSRAIVEYVVDHDIDRVVMGSSGRSGAERFLLGSVAETVIRRSTVPVMVVR